MDKKKKIIGVLTSNKHIKWNGVLKSGIEKGGYEFRLISNLKKDHVKKCSLIWIVGYKQTGNPLKQQCIRQAKKYNVSIVYVDAGAFYDRIGIPVNGKGDNKRLFGISVDGWKNKGLKYLDYIDIEDGEFERKIQPITGLEILPMKPVEMGCTASVLLHNVSGCAIDYSTVFKQMKACTKLKNNLETFGYNVIVSYHPLHPDKFQHRKRDNNKTKTRYPFTISIKDIIKKSSICLGWHTNTLCWTYLQGISTVCYDPIGYCYDIASKDFDDLKSPSVEERYKWANRIAYSNFTLKEILSGEVWERIEPYLKAKKRRVAQ